MTNSEIFTNIKSDEEHDSFQERGEIQETIGYTISNKPSKNEDGHYDFANAQTIEESDKNCFAKKVSIKEIKKRNQTQVLRQG